MRTWHTTVTLAVMDMHIDDCIVWDAKHKALDEATNTFGRSCEQAHIMHAKAREAQHKAIQKGQAPDHVVALLDWVLLKTRTAANTAVDAFQKQFHDTLLPMYLLTTCQFWFTVPTMPPLSSI